MKKFYKKLINTAAIAVMVFAFNIVAFAQGTTSISVSKNNIGVGDTVTVSVTGSESGSITVKYTSSMLTLSSCSVSGYEAKGNSVTFSGKAGDLVFSAASEGTASIIVSSTANSGSSTTLTVGGSGAATAPAQTQAPAQEAPAQEEAEAEAAPAEEAPAETVDAAAQTSAPANGAVGTLNSEGGFDINGVKYVVSERYTDSEVPSGFSKTTIKIGSSTYSEPTNGAITLLYLKPADNTAGSGVFYLYDEAAGTVSQFLMVGSSKSYVIVSTPSEAISPAFTATSVEVTGGAASAYTIDGAEFFYVYGVNQDGAAGWYLFDKTYNTVSRVDTAALTTGATDTSSDDDVVAAPSDDNRIYVEKLGLYRKIIMGLIILCVVLLFIIINKAIKGGNDDDDFDGDVFAKAPVKASRRLPRSIVFNSREKDEKEEEVFPEEDEEDEYADDEEYVEEDEEYYEEDFEDESSAEYESDSYESRRSSSLNMMDLNDL